MKPMRSVPTLRISVALAAALAAAHSHDLRAQAADDVRAQIAKAIPGGNSLPGRKSPDHGAAQALRTVYARNADAPLWSRDGHPTPQAEGVLRELQNADAYGLRSQDYAAPAIARLENTKGASAGTEAHWAQFDVRLSAAALAFMSDLHYGRVDPKSAGFNLQGTHQELDLAASLEGLAKSVDVSAEFASVEPPFYHYHLLKEHLPLYLKLARQPELTHLTPVSATLKPGSSYAGAPALRRLLTALGDLPAGTNTPSPDSTFDADLSNGVRSFQQRHGLPPDGALGKATFKALTTRPAQRVRQIDLTLERWRWLPPFQTPPIVVNIPQFRLFEFRTTEDRAANILQMNVIVGKTFPRMQTPVFESNMTYAVIRPYWDVPRSITVNEMLPKIRANSGYVAAQRLQIVSGQSDSSPAVAPTPEAIAALASGRLRLRQMPGEDNALGLIKFMFPNNYNVYLHSTPAHRLFNESVRAFSHGCIRVSDPVALATDVLKNAPGDWTREKVAAAMNDGKTIRVNLTQPISVLILYGTALATEAGPILFFDDIYGYDKRLERELGLAPVH